MVAILQPAGACAEQWRSVVGYEGRYEVSDLGQVRNAKTGLLLRGGTTSRGYLTVTLYCGASPKRPRSHTVHSLVAAAFLGARGEGVTVDHINGNRKDNRLVNIRYASMSQNIVNRNAPKRSGGRFATQFRGVEKRYRRYVATINFEGERRALGRFDTAEQAAIAYDAAAKELHGEFAVLNYTTAAHPAPVASH